LLYKGTYKYGLPLKTIKSATRQILDTLHILHDKLHVVHSDIKTANIFFQGKNFGTEDIKALFNEVNFDQQYAELIGNVKMNPAIKKIKTSRLAKDCVVQLTEKIDELVGDSYSDDEREEEDSKVNNEEESDYSDYSETEFPPEEDVEEEIG